VSFEDVEVLAEFQVRCLLFPFAARLAVPLPERLATI
jgi:hypothetical protein